MQFNDAEEVDLKLCLLSGSPIYLDNLEIHPYTLNEVKEYGYTRYINTLQWISFSVGEFIDSVKDENNRKFLEDSVDNLKPFDFYFKIGGESMQAMLIESLSMIFKTDDVKVIDENGIIALGLEELEVIKYDDNGDYYIDHDMAETLNDNDFKLIHRDNFDDIVYIVRLQNYLEKSESIADKKSVSADSKTERLKRHMEEMRRKVEEKKRKQKSSDGDEIDISDIISAISSKSNSINITNVWNLSLYQIYDAYARLEMIDDYEYKIKAMMAGSEEMELRHWSSRM